MLLPNHVGDFSNKCLYPSLLLPSLCGTPVILSRYPPPIPPLLWHLQKLGMSCCHVRALANLPVCVAACMSICCLWLLFFLSWETEAGMLSFICSYAEPSTVRRTSLSSEKRDYYLLRFWEGSCELKGGGEGKRYVNQSIWGFIWAWWWWFFPQGSPLWVLCALSQTFPSHLLSLPPPHPHACSLPALGAGALDILLHPCPPSRSTQRSKRPKQRIHNTSEDALSQPQERGISPRAGPVWGFTQRTAERLVMGWFGPVFKVQVVM